MSRKFSPQTGAALQALFVTFLWSTSWVLIKIGLKDMPALTFAGLRYGLAFVCLLPFLFNPDRRSALRGLSRRDWSLLLALGLLFYAVTQGAQFVGLFYLPAITVNLLLNFTSIVVALLGILLLAEKPTVRQWGGLLSSIVGGLIYFYPIVLPSDQALGLIIVLLGVLANAVSAVLGRHINRSQRIPPLIVTVISMGFGGLVLLAAGVFGQGLPPLKLTDVLIILWLAVVNTAFAFTLWNHTLRALGAMESSIINSTLLIQIPILAVIFLGETLTFQQVVGLILAGAGALIVQLRRRK
jgi:drug/metabolite transporter (DMT)-like permease